MSELNANPQKRSTSIFWRAYMLTWAVLAGGALAYMSLFALKTERGDTTLAKPLQSNQEPNRSDLDPAKLSAQVRSLNETVATLRTDLDRFKYSQDGIQSQSPQSPPPLADPFVSDAPTHDTTRTEPPEPKASTITTSSLAKSPTVNAPTVLNAKPEATEEGKQVASEPSRVAGNAAETTAPKSVTDAASATPKKDAAASALPPASQPALPPVAAAAPATPPATKPRRRRNLATSPLRAGRLPPLPPFDARDSNSAAIPNPFQASQLKPTTATSSITTASIPAPLKSGAAAAVANPRSDVRPTAFGKPTVAPRIAAGSSALSLSTAQSVTGLRASWLLLTSRYPEIFVSYQPRYLADQSNGTYRLLAGPIASHAEADRICTDLRARNVSCGVTAYIGSALQ